MANRVLGPDDYGDVSTPVRLSALLTAMEKDGWTLRCAVGRMLVFYDNGKATGGSLVEDDGGPSFGRW